MSGGHRRVARWASLCAVLAVALASWASADAGPRAPSLEADTWPAAPALGEADRLADMGQIRYWEFIGAVIGVDEFPIADLDRKSVV